MDEGRGTVADTRQRFKMKSSVISSLYVCPQQQTAESTGFAARRWGHRGRLTWETLDYTGLMLVAANISDINRSIIVLCTSNYLHLSFTALNPCPWPLRRFATLGDD
jgi:hypothetical protein